MKGRFWRDVEYHLRLREICRWFVRTFWIEIR